VDIPNRLLIDGGNHEAHIVVIEQPRDIQLFPNLAVSLAKQLRVVSTVEGVGLADQHAQRVIVIEASPANREWHGTRLPLSMDRRRHPVGDGRRQPIENGSVPPSRRAFRLTVCLWHPRARTCDANQSVKDTDDHSGYCILYP